MGNICIYFLSYFLLINRKNYPMSKRKCFIIGHLIAAFILKRILIFFDYGVCSAYRQAESKNPDQTVSKEQSALDVLLSLA